jgi:hypothetical protein
MTTERDIQLSAKDQEAILKKYFRNPPQTPEEAKIILDNYHSGDPRYMNVGNPEVYAILFRMSSKAVKEEKTKLKGSEKTPKFTRNGKRIH